MGKFKKKFTNWFAQKVGDNGSGKVCKKCNTAPELRTGLDKKKHCQCSLETQLLTTQVQTAILSLHLLNAARPNTDTSVYTSSDLDFSKCSPNQLRKMVHSIERTLEEKEGKLSKTAILRKSFRKSMRKAQMAVGITQDEQSKYAMDHPERGIHLIFAQQNFDPNTNQANRVGTDFDIRALKEAMGYLEFHNMIFNDLTVDEIKRILLDASQLDHGRCDAIAITVLSHGDETRIWGRDGTLAAEDLWKPFEKCPTLAGKPKLFISNTCQGKGKCPILQTDGPSGLKVPSKQDFLWAYSTSPGDVSYRNPYKGSYFIQALCDVIRKDGKDKDFEDILKTANRKTVADLQAISQEATQMPNYKTTLTKKLKFSNKYSTTC